MHLPKSQSDNFYHLIYMLAEFVESKYHVAGIPQSLTSFSSPKDAQTIINAIASNPYMIDEFITCTPIELSVKDIEILEQWKHPLAGNFLLKEYAQNGNATLLTSIGLVSVEGLTQEISDLILETPSIINTVLLPYGEVITYACNIIEFPTVFGEGMQALFQDWDEEESISSIIATAKDFIEQRNTYFKKTEIEGIEELERQTQREAARNTGTLPVSPGFHKGVLAELNDEERERAIRGHLSNAFFKDPERKKAFEQSFKNKKPLDTLSECLGCFTKTELNELLYDLNIGASPSEKKSSLIELLSSSLLDPEKLKASLREIPSGVLLRCKKLLEAGGRIDFTYKDTLTPDVVIPNPPISFGSITGNDSYSILIPSDLQNVLEKVDIEAVIDFRSKLESVHNIIVFASQLYGIIDIDDLHQLLSSELNLSHDDLVMTIDLSLSREEQDYSLVPKNGKDCLLSYELNPQDNYDYYLDDNIMLEKEMTEYQDHILDRQREIGLRPFPEVGESFFEWVMQLPSAKQLRQWLDSHVPNDANDHAYSDAVIEELFDMTRRPSKPTEFIEILKDHGSFSKDRDEANELIALTTRFINDIPIWANAGWSPTELLERETGKKVFFRDDGRPMKIGRNDPCPCGSGKKYKKCCGA